MAKATTNHNWTADEVAKLVKLYGEGKGTAEIGRKLGRSWGAATKKLRRMVDGSDTDAIGQLAGTRLSDLRRCCQLMERPLPKVLLDRISNMQKGVLELALLIVSADMPLTAYRDILAPDTYGQLSTIVTAMQGACPSGQ